MPGPTGAGLVQSPRELDRLARAGFTYLADPDGDLWRSHADDALNGRKWAGDCDDLASTVLDLASRDGYRLDRLFRLFVSTGKSKAPDHMVAVMKGPDLKLWVVGDTFKPAYRLSEMTHRPVFYEKMDVAAAGVLWKGAPA